MEQSTTNNTVMCDKCNTMISGTLRTHNQNVHQTTTCFNVTFDGQTLAYRLERQDDNKFHCPCGKYHRASAKNVGTHGRNCRAGFVVELAKRAAIEAEQAATVTVEESVVVDEPQAASITEENVAGEEQSQQVDTSEHEDETMEKDTFHVDNEIGRFHGIFNSALYRRFGIQIHVASGAIICQKCTAAVELSSVYTHLKQDTHAYTNSEARRIGKNALLALLVANGAKTFEEMGPYHEPTREKLDWIPSLEIHQGHVCKICYEEGIWMATKSWRTMGHHFTNEHTYEGRENNTFTREIQTVFGNNKATYFGIKERHQQDQVQTSTTATQQQLEFLERHPTAKVITTLNHYGDDALITDHRDKLANSFIEHFKLQSFFDEFNVIEGLSTMQLRKLLNRFASREIPRKTPVFDAIRKTAHTFFGRVNDILQNSDVGYYWRRQVKTMNEGELTTRGLNALQGPTLTKYVDIWANMIIMLARTI